jgi:hypothetical protein
MRRDGLGVDAGHTQPTVELAARNSQNDSGAISRRPGELVGVERVLENEVALLVELAGLLGVTVVKDPRVRAR